MIGIIKNPLLVCEKCEMFKFIIAPQRVQSKRDSGLIPLIIGGNCKEGRTVQVNFE